MARIFLDEMGGINQGGILGSYGLPASPFSTEDYVAPASEQRAVSTRRKQAKHKGSTKSSKRSNNDGIIRNHDSVWDYKIQDGKLLTRRKSSNGNWIDITDNTEAKTEIERFTGKSISSKSKTNDNPKSSSQQTTSTRQQAVSQTTPASTQPKQNTSSPSKARQDSTPLQSTQQRTLAATPASESYDLPGITVTATTTRQNNNSNKSSRPLLNQEDLDANGWRWSNAFNGANSSNRSALQQSARDKIVSGDNILVDSNGDPVPTSEVNRYVNRGRIPLYVSDYDAQFYQPQAYSKPHDVRMAELRRWNYNYDKQQNAALATMFGLPALIGAGATAPLATVGAIGGGELLNQGAKALGIDWDKWIGGKNDANAEFYGAMLNPFRAAGSVAGGVAGNALQPKVSEFVNPYINRAAGYLTDRFTNMMNPYRNAAYPPLAATEETAGTRALANAMDLALEGKEPREFSMPKLSLKGSGNSKKQSLASAKDATKSYWEERQPYEVTVKQDAQGRLFPKFNTKKTNSRFRGYPSYDDVNRLNQNADVLETILSNYADVSRSGRIGITRDAIQGLKRDINDLYGLPSGYWQSARPAPGYVDGPRYGTIILGQ